MHFLEDIRKQPKHVREIMFSLCVITTVSLIGLIWFRSFEEDIFVLLNPEDEKQEQFFAERAKRTPTAYAAVTKSFSSMQAAFYNAFGFFDSGVSSKEIIIEDDYKGEVHKLPLSGDR